MCTKVFVSLYYVCDRVCTFEFWSVCTCACLSHKECQARTRGPSGPIFSSCRPEVSVHFETASMHGHRFYCYVIATSASLTQGGAMTAGRKACTVGRRLIVPTAVTCILLMCRKAQ